ncbi:hypothetical protein RRF57_011953 [Xylaria bambusicola]|uniref:F-box domain-containing protein n=1 Tax=Xylaria bambusicola TaxID=326684 RepID=A0AAN7V161_9PEZI
MEQLPLELTQHVLSYLDPESLADAALSCPLLYDAFRGAESLISKSALFQQIDPTQVLPEAILVFDSSKLGIPSVTERLEFATKNLKERQPMPTS